MNAQLLESSIVERPDTLICLSHLRWGFVYQRPQHLLSRFAKDFRVLYWEEPLFDSSTPNLARHVCPRSGIEILAPHLPEGLGGDTRNTILRLLFSQFVKEQNIQNPLLWYYTPMALDFSRHLDAALTVFDCMDELSAFKDAPAEMKEREAELLSRAALVFTGGQSLYEAKLGRHRDLHCFPSSIEYDHFAKARRPQPDPADQAGIPGPRIGYCGVIDERMSLDLIDSCAALRPGLHFVLLGPVVKIEETALPRRANIHYLGCKSYDELPAYLSNWNAAMLPFAHNESTRFISPTKTPEYLAAGLPVVSTSIMDVVRPYGSSNIVRIADDPESFTSAIDRCMSEDASSAEWLSGVDALLAQNSWDLTHRKMRALIDAKLTAQAMTPMPAKAPSRALTFGD